MSYSQQSALLLTLLCLRPVVRPSVHRGLPAPGCTSIRAPGARGRHPKSGPAFLPRRLFFRKEKNRKYNPKTDPSIRNTRLRPLPQPKDFAKLIYPCSWT